MKSLKKIGYNENFDIQIVNSKDSLKRKNYTQYLFKKIQREKGIKNLEIKETWVMCFIQHH